MKEAAEDRVKIPQILPVLYAPIQVGIHQVEEVFREVLRSKYPFVDDLVKYGFRLGGKRLRPALVLLSGLACGSFGSDHVLLAAAVEMIHTATLIHDDVLDEATMRRHLDTVNARWDNETSVLLGDYLFARALCLASSLEDVFASRELHNASRIMCEGELRQIESRGDYGLTEEQYYEIVRGKTAALTASCCRLGAHFSGADLEVEEALARYGLHLGVAFQIADDLLDVLGDEAQGRQVLGHRSLEAEIDPAGHSALGAGLPRSPQPRDRTTPHFRQPPSRHCCDRTGTTPIPLPMPAKRRLFSANLPCSNWTCSRPPRPAIP